MFGRARIEDARLAFYIPVDDDFSLAFIIGVAACIPDYPLGSPRSGIGHDSFAFGAHCPCYVGYALIP